VGRDYGPLSMVKLIAIWSELMGFYREMVDVIPDSFSRSLAMQPFEMLMRYLTK
jgi:hypothetical protein